MREFPKVQYQLHSKGIFPMMEHLKHSLFYEQMKRLRREFPNVRFDLKREENYEYNLGQAKVF